MTVSKCATTQSVRTSARAFPATGCQATRGTVLVSLIQVSLDLLRMRNHPLPPPSLHPIARRTMEVCNTECTHCYLTCETAHIINTIESERVRLKATRYT